MKGVAQGLQTLHGANIVHGSLHGNNVFAVNRKQGIVGDFDFTKSEVKQTKPKLVVLFFLVGYVSKMKCICSLFVRYIDKRYALQQFVSTSD